MSLTHDMNSEITRAMDYPTVLHSHDRGLDGRRLCFWNHLEVEEVATVRHWNCRRLSLNDTASVGHLLSLHQCS